jgi:fatty-acyl-CoA synthase
MQVNDSQLTPLMFLERSAIAFPDKPAIRDGDALTSYAEMAAHATEMARAFTASGIEAGDRVAYLCPNTPEMLIAHFAVPLVGAVLVAVNTRLSPDEIAYILDHSGARMLVVDGSLTGSVETILGERNLDEVVAIGGNGGLTATDYDSFRARGADGEPLPWRVDDEQRTIAINYTSGTTGRPKGVMYTHRGAYLNALGEAMHSKHDPSSVYLWTLPMFHCNGWCTTWGVTAVGGTHVALRAVDPAEIWQLIGAVGVTHLNAAPTVLISLANHPDARPVEGGLVATTAGAPPSPTIIAQMGDLGIEVVHVYGLTETYGPMTVCEVQPEWAELDPDARVRMVARQGISMVIADPVRVVDEDMQDVPRDGATLGEVVMRGNSVMSGYHDDPEATAEAFRGGWFHSGDAAVWHPDGYIELRDRFKDVIISGGENISTIEVEQALMSHPAVLEAAVVATPHEKWGERPKGFVILKPGQEVDEATLIEHVKGRIARFKAPDEVEFLDAFPKTSTGKIQKFVLREREWTEHGARRIN